MLPENDPAVRDRVVRLMGVLRSLAAAKHRPVRQVTNHPGLIWLARAQEHCTVRAPEAPGDEVLRMPRVQLEPEPAPPAVLENWLLRPATSDAVGEPSLRERGPRPGYGDGEVRLGEAPEVIAAFSTWMREWRPWAERERRLRPRLRMFESLFDLHRLAADRPESIELVLAAGLLHVPATDESPAVRIHVLSQPVRIEQDTVTGEMLCILNEGGGLRLEDDELLSGLPLYDPSGSATMRERLHELAGTPVDAGVAAFLKEWTVRSLRVTAPVDDGWDEPTGSSSGLTMAPALIARRRGAFALRAYYDAIGRSLAEEPTPVPLGLAQLVESYEPNERVAWLERTGALAAAELATDPLFPRPANEEQAQIIGRLGADSGVVVEGPPGTGKTHTIANLVSALLARGQRVLVTSEKAQALRVLQDKLPPGIQELCVSVTDPSARGSADLARSVATMAGRKTDFDPARADRDIRDLSGRRDAADRKRADLLEQIRELRSSETVRHAEVAPGYAGTLSAMARRVADSAAQDGWVGGRVAGQPPLTAEEFTELVNLTRAGDPERAERRGQEFPDPERVPAPVHVAELAAAVEAGDAVRSGQDGELVGALEGLPGAALRELEPRSDRVAESVAGLRRLPTDRAWAERVADRLLTGSGEHLWRRATGQLDLMGAAVEHDRAAGFDPVTVAGGVDPARAAGVLERFVAHVRGGGRLRGFFKSTPQKELEALGTDVLVSGEPPRSEEAAETARHHLLTLDKGRQLGQAFAPLGVELPLAGDRAVLVERMLDLQRACGAVDDTIAAATPLVELLGQLPPASRPLVTSVAALDRIASLARRVARANRASAARAELDHAVDTLLASTQPAARPPELMGLLHALRLADAEGYRQAAAALDAALRRQREQLRCDELHERLNSAAPRLARELAATAADPHWDDRAARWLPAWHRACAEAWISRRISAGRAQQLEGELAAATRDLELLTGELAAAQAWRSCLTRMSQKQMQALQSYRAAMTNVRGGTGKHAERYRQAARDAMTVAQSAVPAWIMPIQQVLSSIPPEPGAFDVVIVDEASQVDLTSAFLLWLAPRVIVVGDDNQCTPSEVASGALDPIFDRLRAELHDLPSYIRDGFTPRDSVFSLLRSRFGQVVRLREHFRCMPEIIEWSSREFYSDAPLIPLRQYGADRLPPLRATRVDGAETEGKSQSLVNKAEADAIAASVAACLKDPAYDGRTFGVVVLQGAAQVELIDQRLRDIVPTEKWDERRLRVGNPPDFQGDERHVVWLSMVVAPNTETIALTRREFRQRFNVAASRAQDQLWLFHSVTLDDLGQRDLRRSLLSHVTTAGTAPLPPVLAGVERTRRHEAFECLFEQEVFADLAERGYHVTPQVETNGKRIDLVVTGAAGRLAVECDGEGYPIAVDLQRADVLREQELKRCGWRFERIRESLYRLDRDLALAPLWAALDRFQISPLLATGEPAAATGRPIEEPERPGSATGASAVAVEDGAGGHDLAHPAPIDVGEDVAPPAEDPVADAAVDEPDEAAVAPEGHAESGLAEPSDQAQRSAEPEPQTSPLSHTSDRGLRRPPSGPPSNPFRLSKPSAARAARQTEHEARTLPSAAAVRPRLPADPFRVPAEPPLAPQGPRPDARAEEQVERQPDEPPPNFMRALLLQRAATASLTTKWVADTLAIGLQEARDMLGRLVEEGTLRRVGAGRGLRYVLPEWSEVRDTRAGQPTQRTLVTGPAQQEQVLRAARFRTLTNERVRALLDVTPAQATEILGALVAQGRLRRTGQGRGTQYALTAPTPVTPSAPPADADAEVVEAAPTGSDADLERGLLQLTDRILRETGLDLRALHQLIDERGGRATVSTLLRPGAPAYGFVELWTRDRLDLSVEAYVLGRPEFGALLSADELEHARRRLAEYRRGRTGPGASSEHWLQERGVAGADGRAGWLLRRVELAGPWPHEEMSRGFRYLVGERRRGSLVITARATVTAHLPFVEVASLAEAHKLARHLLETEGVTVGRWTTNPYNVRVRERGSWPLQFTCWTVDEQAIPAITLMGGNGEMPGRTGWVRRTIPPAAWG